ncbi:hypothetical protein GLAREA_04391 [Glarea lozoyensis ATCC 20868]|uniref:Uncharacterized protein n=1 Tax=Glarea lozoyensis (strain ATCC 20868 / MF5171) TaxID=1116229 RepID=S3CPH3_GLAL2|nr:uncharacterized protein GLAREA_04391 [Glarea lozoyensis ATCC 20868]EPE27600.1 hypothetical protein GLAREA_04391 [Glarea lozoyensis ATCC 20868]
MSVKPGRLSETVNLASCALYKTTIRRDSEEEKVKIAGIIESQRMYAVPAHIIGLGGKAPLQPGSLAIVLKDIRFNECNHFGYGLVVLLPNISPNKSRPLRLPPFIGWNKADFMQNGRENKDVFLIGHLLAVDQFF